MTALRSATPQVVLHPSADLARFVAELRFSDIPAEVVSRCEDLFLDTMGSILAGSTARPVRSMAKYAELMRSSASVSADKSEKQING